MPATRRSHLAQTSSSSPARAARAATTRSGLPALYSEVLASQHLPAWKRYAYLALYDGFYMLDDMIMVGIAVVTLGHHKLQERGGQWLKLLSGVVMLLLALVLLFRPGWLTRW